MLPVDQSGAMQSLVLVGMYQTQNEWIKLPAEIENGRRLAHMDFQHMALHAASGTCFISSRSVLLCRNISSMVFMVDISLHTEMLL